MIKQDRNPVNSNNKDRVREEAGIMTAQILKKFLTCFSVVVCLKMVAQDANKPGLKVSTIIVEVRMAGKGNKHNKETKIH